MKELTQEELNVGNGLITWMNERLEEKRAAGTTDSYALVVMKSLVAKLNAATPEAKADLTEDECECMAGAIIAYMEDL